MKQFGLGRWLAGFLPFLVIAASPAIQAQSDLLLTEVYYDTPGRDEAEEWVEIANLGAGLLPLAGYKLGDAATIGSREGMLAFPEDAVLAGGEVAVIAQSAAGFRALVGRQPDFEIQDSDPAVPDMLPFFLWGSGDFALNNDGDELLLLDPDNRPVDVVNYGDADSFFFPAVDDVVSGQSIARQPAGCDTDSAADWIPLAVPTPGTITLDGDCRPRPDPDIAGELLPIGAVQGTEDISPLINQVVTIRGIVTGQLADQNVDGVTFYTLFIQDEGDGNPQTSDGMAVFLATLPPVHAAGDELLVTGRVTEFFGLTEIDHEDLQIARLSGQNLLPEAVVLTGTGRLEPLESMRVTLPESAVIGPTHTGCGFAVLAGSENGPAPTRLFRRSAADTLPGLLPILHTTDVDCTGFPQLKVGDRVAGLAGPLTYHFDEYKIVQQDPAGLMTTPTEVADVNSFILPEMAASQFSVATFNLENHFDQQRNAEEPVIPLAQVVARETRLAGTIHRFLDCPTLLGVQEVENAALLSSLAGRLAESCGFVYAVAHAESPDARGIDVALLVHPGRVEIHSVTLEQTCTPLETNITDPAVECPAGQFPLHSRPPLRIALTVDGIPYTLYVNHLKSKREGEAETAGWRLAQAAHQHELAQVQLNDDPQARILVMGDFNDYEHSPPLLNLTRPAGVLLNPLLQIPDEKRYTYNFGGAAQLIDGILLSPAVAAQLAVATIVHVNADFPAGWPQENPDSPFRSSDHDIPLLFLDRPEPPATPTTLPTNAPTAKATLEPAGAETPAIGTLAILDGQNEPAPRPFPWLIVLAALLLATMIGGIFYFKQSQ